MASISQLYSQATQLKAEVKAAWIKACEADGIPTDTKFAVFSNTTEAAAYNELMGLFLKAKRAYMRQSEKNASRRARTSILKDMGLRQVRGVSGVYFE